MLKCKLRKHQIQHGRAKAKPGELLLLNLCEKVHWWWDHLTGGECVVLFFTDTAFILFLGDLADPNMPEGKAAISFTVFLVGIGILTTIYIRKKKP